MKYIRFASIALLAAIIPMTYSCKKKEAMAEEGPMRVDVAMPEVDSVIVRKNFPCYLTAHY